MYHQVTRIKNLNNFHFVDIISLADKTNVFA